MSGVEITQDRSFKVENYAANGFAVAEAIFSTEEMEEVRALLEPLFDNFVSKLGKKARDVGALAGIEPGSQQPEIDRATSLEPALFNTAVFLKARRLATQILGRQARYVFDHAISKMPYGETSTAWHQDRGYMRPRVELETVNFWIPLQAVSPENGTLTYIPGSHLGQFIEHRRDPGLHPHVLTADVEPEVTHSPSLALGDMCMHHPLTVHSAGPNHSDSVRLAWAIHFGAYGRLEYLKPSNILQLFRHSVGLR